MPEASIDHYCHTIFRQDYIRTPRQFLVVQAKAKPTGVQSLPNQDFRLGVLATYARHAVISLLSCKFVCHVLLIIFGFFLYLWQWFAISLVDDSVSHFLHISKVTRDVLHDIKIIV